MKNEIVFVRLLNEGIDAFRPVLSLELAPSVFELGEEEYDPEDEEWEFLPGTHVNVEEREFSDGTRRLVASSRKAKNVNDSI